MAFVLLILFDNALGKSNSNNTGMRKNEEIHTRSERNGCGGCDPFLIFLSVSSYQNMSDCSSLHETSKIDKDYQIVL
jgi:hypothetical protein